MPAQTGDTRRLGVTGEAEAPPDSRADRRAATLWPAVLIAIALIGLSARLALMVRGGGLTGIGGYDDGVYYTAADALVHGRLPYRDFLFLQPPGIAVFTAPFAALGAATSDAFGFATARVAFMSVGAVNAVLVCASLRRFGAVAAVVAGLFYAVFAPAVYAERSVLLEPLGTLGVLGAVWLLQRSSTRTARPERYAMLAGVAAGAAADVKIWYVVPLLVLAAFARGRRWRFSLGAAAALVLGYLPFLIAAPAATIREVVLDQLGRPRGTGVLVRLENILGAPTHGPLHPQTVVWLFIATAVVIGVVAAMTRGARLFATMLLADLLVLLAAPSWFPHYAALTAPPLALCLGVAVARLLEATRPRWARAALVGVVLVVIAGTNQGADRNRVGTHVPTTITAARTRGCVIADDPTILAPMNVLSRDLAQPQCIIWPDVSGWTYDRDEARINGVPVARARNVRWQKDVVRYLESGSAVILTRRDTGLSSASRARIAHGAVIAKSGSFVLRSTN